MGSSCATPTDTGNDAATVGALDQATRRTFAVGLTHGSPRSVVASGDASSNWRFSVAGTIWSSESNPTLPQPRRMRPQPAISSYGEPIAGTASTMPTMRPLITSGGRGHASAISCGSRAPGAPDFAPPSSETCVFLGFSGGGSTPLGGTCAFSQGSAPTGTITSSSEASAGCEFYCTLLLGPVEGRWKAPVVTVPAMFVNAPPGPANDAVDSTSRGDGCALYANDPPTRDIMDPRF